MIKDDDDASNPLDIAILDKILYCGFTYLLKLTVKSR